jgi:predicted Fe-Mo cluster-binding NifX family protein
MPTSTEFVPVGASVQPVDAVTMTVANPGHKPGFLPNFLGDMGVEVIIAGGMGGGAVEIFNERNIEVIVGAQGDARSAVESYLHGELKSTGSICHEHEHAGECGEHQ